jgi:hypothetical protein
MKIVPMRLLVIFIGMLCCNLSFATAKPRLAAPDPPPPIPPPPGLPIDGGLLILVIVSLLFAFYKIYTYKKRASL